MNKNTWIAVAVVVVVLIIGFFVLGHNGSTPQTQQQPTPASPSANSQAQSGVPSYMSSADNFSVNFPVTPQVNQTTFNSPTAGPIPRTEYLAQSGMASEPQYYVINVYHYPQTYQFPSMYLTGALQVFVAAVTAKYPGAKLVSQSQVQFLGSPAITATMSVTIAGKQTMAYLLIVTNGQNTYGMGTYGAAQSDYNAFVNSFAFTQ